MAKNKTQERQNNTSGLFVCLLFCKNVFIFILIELLITLHFKPKTREHSKQA